MPDNVTLPPTGTFVAASDDVGGVQYQRVKLDTGGDGVSVPVDYPLASQADVQAVRDRLPITPHTQPLTDAQLRASAVPISVASLPLPATAATEASVSASATALGGLTDAEATGNGSVIAILKRLRTLLGSLGLDATLQAIRDRLPSALVGGRLDVNVGASTTLMVTHGGLTNSELRASAVPVSVSGGVEINNDSGSPIAVSAASLPLPTDAATQTTLAAMNAKVPAQGAAARAASLPVTIATDQPALTTVEPALALTGAAAQTATVNNILEDPSSATATAVDNFRSASVQVVSTGTAGTFIFEQSNDNTSWIPLPVYNSALTTGVPIVAAITATNSQIIYTVPLWCRFIRLRIATTITGGSIRAFSRLSPDPWTPSVTTVAQPTAGSLNATVAGTVTANLGAATTRAGFVAGAGIWYDDSSTNLAGAATFTGTSRDATVTATATAFANAATYAKEVRLSAESDVTGTLWLEVSRDNTNWRRVKSVATAAVAGGGFYAEIIHAPSWRYWRAGYTNGAGAQARFSIGSIAVAL